MISNPYGKPSIDFADPVAVRVFNRALLKSLYGIAHWQIAEGYLCPPVPGRADYLHGLADLLARENAGTIPRGASVRVLDIGVGANCIYPLLGHADYGWHFLGSDIDPAALACARGNVDGNQLQAAIDMLQQFELWEAQALALSKGLESRLSLAIAPELLASDWAGPLADLALRYPSLQVEVLAAPEDDAIRLLHEGRVQLAVVFESPQYDSRECCQEMARENLLAVIAPDHPALAGGRTLSTEGLAEYRQIVVAGRSPGKAPPRFLQAHHHWPTDSHTAALTMVQAGLGWGFLPESLVRPQLNAGSLVEMTLDNISSFSALWVDVIWSSTRPLGLGARHFIELIRARQKGAPQRQQA